MIPFLTFLSPACIALFCNTLYNDISQSHFHGYNLLFRIIQSEVVFMKRESMRIGLAYVGVIVGAGLSSGQDLLQYFLSFGSIGILGALALGMLNILFGRIMVTLGSYYQANSHQEVLEKITTPLVNRVIDGTLILSNFVMGFVMVAGAGANLHQQFSVPSWAGALFCSVLIVAVSFLNFEKITQVLGVFTPVIVAMIFGITLYTFIGGSYDFTALDVAAKTITPAMPALWLSVINYFALCALTGVSMAFVLGGSVVRIGIAEKGGLLGGTMIGFVISCAAATLFAHIDKVKDVEIPMLMIVHDIHPVLSVIYAFIIFALIFNTAFSLFYATARRFAGSDTRKMRLWMIGIVAAGYACSFGGFRALVGHMYPILGYMGLLLLLVLLLAWLRNHRDIVDEMFLRRKMIRLHLKKHDETREFTAKDQKLFDRLGEKSIADTDALQQDIKDYAKEIIQSPVDIDSFVKKELPMKGNEPK